MISVEFVPIRFIRFVAMSDVVLVSGLSALHNLVFQYAQLRLDARFGRRFARRRVARRLRDRLEKQIVVVFGNVFGQGGEATGAAAERSHPVMAGWLPDVDDVDSFVFVFRLLNIEVFCVSGCCFDTRASYRCNSGGVYSRDDQLSGLHLIGREDA